ncbi:MAG: alpha/beta hydrolase, partial [Anaerolineae bacterium]|nr:alpha/beta hydrolase [Anaerolineae bacterium]
MKRIIFLLGLWLLTMLPITAAQDIEFEPVFEPTDCFFELPEGVVEGEDVECGYVTVPEEHALPNGNTIRLATVLIHSSDSSPETPLVMAQGGPGGSTIDLFAELMLGSLSSLFRPERDIILFDQRGTYYSEPSLLCEESFALTMDTLDDNLTAEESMGMYSEALLACHERLLAEGINLSAFDSVENAADVPMVVKALGYDEYNFYGVSYGSLLAFHLIRDYPEGLRSVIVDAIVPTSTNFIPATPTNGNRALRLLFETCAADPECSTHYPALETTFLEMLDTLNTTPVIVPITDPHTGETYDMLVNGDMLASLTFSGLYSTAILPNFPKFVYEMAQGNFNWITIYGGELMLDATSAEGMQLSVMCAEDSDFSADEVVLEGAYPIYEETLQLFSESYLEWCQVWSVEALASFVDDPVVSDIPTLVMSGQFDPITPPVWGEIAGETLSNGYVYEFPGIGHGSLFGGVCPISMALDFLSDPTQAPNASCMNDMRISFTAPAAGIITT